MKFEELKKVISRHEGRHEWISISIGLGSDALIQAESPILDCLDDYEISYINPGTVGESTVTDDAVPCIEVHLKEKPKTIEEQRNEQVPKNKK